MDAKALLAEMARIFEEKPQHWTQGAFARDAANEAVDPLSEEAFSFSINGFIVRCAGEMILSLEEAGRCYSLICDAIFARFHHRSIVALNDSTDLATVVSVLREAAK
jgi:hypothetical protein